MTVRDFCNSISLICSRTFRICSRAAHRWVSCGDQLYLTIVLMRVRFAGLCVRSKLPIIGAFALSACATAMGPPGKPQASLDSENALCSRYALNRELVYAQCMLNFGNTVRLSDGRILEPQQYTYAPPPNPALLYPAPPAPSYPAPERLPEAAQPASAAVRFRNVVLENQEGIFKAAHPSSKLDNASSDIIRSDNSGAVIVDNLFWHGPSGRTFQTMLQFTIYYDTQGNISSADMKIAESGNPLFSAFEGLNITKEVALSYFSSKLLR